MAKKRAGRPTKQNSETVKKLEEAFAIDATVEEACFYADISTVTFYSWMKANPLLSNRFEALRNRPVLQARQTIMNNLSDPNTAKWYLEKKKKKEFGAALDVTSDNKPLQTNVFNTINKVYGEPESTGEVPAHS